MFDVVTGKELRKRDGVDSSHERLRLYARGEDYLWAGALSPDGKILVAPTKIGDGTISLWDLDTWKESRKLEGHTTAISALAFSPDGRLLASAAGAVVRLWDVAGGKELRQLIEHEGAVRSLVFSPDGKVLASGGIDKVVRLWNVKIGELFPLYGEHASEITTMAFSPDGQVLASGDDEGWLKFWKVDAEKGSLALLATARQGC